MRGHNSGFCGVPLNRTISQTGKRSERGIKHRARPGTEFLNALARRGLKDQGLLLPGDLFKHLGVIAQGLRLNGAVVIAFSND